MSQLENNSNPTIYSIFNAVNKETGKTIACRIQDLTEDLFESALNLFLQHFNTDEVLAKIMKIWEDLASIKEMSDLWMEVFQQKVSLACFNNETNELIGVNALCIETGKEVYHAEAEKWKKMYDANMLVASKVDVCEKYHVDKYLGAFGLVVHKDYRGFGIGTEILKARIPLCKKLGLKVTSNNFSGAQSQRVAEKVGFVTDIAVTYKNLAKLGFDFGNINEECIKVMSLKV